MSAERLCSSSWVEDRESAWSVKVNMSDLGARGTYVDDLAAVLRCSLTHSPAPPKFGAMRHSRVLVLVCLLVACERPESAPPPPDTIPARPIEAQPVTVEATTGWEIALGPVLAIATAESPARAMLVSPYYPDGSIEDTTVFDLSAARGLAVDLFARAGKVGEARLAPPSERAVALPADDPEACPAWPEVSLVVANGTTPPSWTVAVERGRATAIALDSIETFSRSDSVRLTADLARLASAIPNDTGRAFVGLPFAVRRLRRFDVDSSRIVVADLVRTINSEADPRAEHTLLVVERDLRDGTRRWTAVWHDRASGPEETVQTTNLLGALRVRRTGAVLLVLAREFADGARFSFIEREAPLRWRERWRSAYVGC